MKTSLSPQHISDLEHAWFNSIIGRYLQQEEQALYDKAVVDLFGFNALQMGCLEMDLLRNSRIPNRYKSSEFDLSNDNYDLCCNDDFLPFAEMSLDLLLLPHRLEFSERPHQTLREAERVMMPEGHLLISGFNPFSTWGAKSGLNKMFRDKAIYPWHGQFIGLTRMKDWLTLLGFEILSVDSCCHVPPFEQLNWHKRFAFLDKFSERYCPMPGGVYFIVAKKRVVGMTPLKPNWKTAPLKPTLVIRPTQSRPTQQKSSKQGTLKQNNGTKK
jgi:SAM-dependent methyltransferase